MTDRAIRIFLSLFQLAMGALALGAALAYQDMGDSFNAGAYYTLLFLFMLSAFAVWPVRA